jgi:hypothetical protein
MKTVVVFAAALLAASPSIAKTRGQALADQAAAEGYRVASDFERVKAMCEQAADGAPQPGYFAFGNSQFVAGASLGHGLGSLIRHARAYDQCMASHGLVK